METTRRGFFGIVLGATATGTLLTNNAVAKVILQYPEDPISGTIRRAKEMLTLGDLLKAKRAATGQSYSKMDEYEQFLGVSDAFLNYMMDNFAVVPHPDQAHALFEGYLFPRKRNSRMYEVDCLDETLLRSMSHGLIPMWLAKASIQVYKLPWNSMRMPSFDRFGDYYRDTFMDAAPSNEYHKRREAIWKAPNEETEYRLRVEMSEWLTTRHLQKPTIIL